MQKFLVCLTLVTLSGSQVFGEAESDARQDTNLKSQEVVPLDQVQAIPWQSSESYPTYATNSAPFPYTYYGGYPQGNQMIQPRMLDSQTYQSQNYPQVYQIQNQPQVYQTQTQPQMYQSLTQPQMFQALTQPQMYQSLTQPQMYQSLTQPQVYQSQPQGQVYQSQPQGQIYQSQPLSYPMQQQYQQLSWPENYGSMANMEILPQTESGVVESGIVQGNNVETQMWGQPSGSWGNTNGIPTWKRSYTPLPGQSGCYNRCKPSCSPNSCQSSCQSACNIRPTCGRRGQVSYNGNTMICGRPGYNQAGVWPEVKPWQDYQNTWEQSMSQGSVNMNGLQGSSMVMPSNIEVVPATVN